MKRSTCLKSVYVYLYAFYSIPKKRVCAIVGFQGSNSFFSLKYRHCYASSCAQTLIMQMLNFIQNLISVSQTGKCQPFYYRVLIIAYFKKNGLPLSNSKFNNLEKANIKS